MSTANVEKYSPGLHHLTTDVIVVGGGASGYFAAISAKTHHPHKRVLLLEATGKPLQKVLISGGGRCNVTHACYDARELIAHYPRGGKGGKALLGLFHAFGPGDTISWFAEQGVTLTTEADGRLFPDTNTSETIAHCLQDTARTLGVETRLNTRINALMRFTEDEQPLWRLTTTEGKSFEAPEVILSLGGARPGFDLVAGVGVPMTSGVPSLFTFNSPDKRLQGLSGVSFKQVSAWLKADSNYPVSAEQSGPLLITHWGLSGPAVLRLSAWEARRLFACGYQAQVAVNVLPALSAAQVLMALKDYRQAHPKRLVVRHAPDEFVGIPQRFWEATVAYCGIPETLQWGNLAKAQMQALVASLTEGTFAITGKGVFKEEFVTAGGVDWDGLHGNTLECKAAPGLYIVGELLNADGITGGFNFQLAWSSGWVAGQLKGAFQ